MANRENWDAYFIRIAEVVASRATCDRKKVGAVLVKNQNIISTGYNGAPAGMPHCDEVGHELKDMGGRESCVRTVHAEANALIQAAKHGNSVNGCILYCTASPCYDCAKLIINSGVNYVIVKEFYDSRYGLSSTVGDLLKGSGIPLVKLSDIAQIIQTSDIELK